MMTERVFARAEAMAGDLTEQETGLLKTLCTSSCAALEARLKEGLTAEDCGEEFLTAAALMALGDLQGFQEEVLEFRAGDLTVKKGDQRGAGLAGCLRQQGEKLMAPYLKDRFWFREV